MTMKYAPLGSVSHGTMRTEDLLASFADALEEQIQRNAELWCSAAGRHARDTYMTIVGEARELDPESEDANIFLNEVLFDALQEFAPPYTYFGAHEGDGSDFGYWLVSEIDDEFVGIKVSDTAEVPADYSGEVLYINDHGNMTLYVANNGALSEIWSVV